MYMHMPRAYLLSPYVHAHHVLRMRTHRAHTAQEAWDEEEWGEEGKDWEVAAYFRGGPLC